MKYESEFENDEIDRIQDEFKRMKDIHYLDHAGATQYSEKQMQQICANLSSSVYCNPHTSKSTEDVVDQVRYKILRHFNTTTDDYSVVFTSGATASLKLIAETFDFNENGSFVYLRDNHTSVLGMREVVQTKRIKCMERSDLLNDRNVCDGKGNSLFVFPAQSNFNGHKYPLKLIDRLQGKSNFVCLDAACFVGTNYLNLTKYRPDFVCISFYKMFGYPSGLGALLVSKRGEPMLHKRYYGGGTVKISFSDASGWHQKRDCLHERLEDGTIPYLSIISLLSGYETLETLVAGQSMCRIARHCFNLSKYLYESLRSLKYANGRDVVRFYHDSAFDSVDRQGGIITFNVVHDDGTYVGFAEVAHMAQLHNIHLRTGCFCNPGACQRHLRLSNDELKRHFMAGHICGDSNDLIDGIPTGAVRISMGYMTTKENVDAVIKMIRDCYCNEKSAKLKAKQNQIPLESNDQETERAAELFSASIKLREICLFPVKSCAALRIDTSWPLTRRGLKYDREWMIVRSNGVAMTQKSDTKLCLIQPIIDVTRNTLQLSFPYADPISIPLHVDMDDNRTVSSFCQSKVCGDRIDGIDCGDRVAEWISDVLCTPGLRLIRQNENDKRSTKTKNDIAEQAISLSNQAQFLLINTASVEWLTKKVNDWSEFDDCNEKIMQNMIDRFRGNLIIESTVPLEELDWQTISFGDGIRLQATGPCTRCEMICIDQSTGEKTTEPLQTICREFQGKMRFGIYLSQSMADEPEREHIISCECKIRIEK